MPARIPPGLAVRVRVPASSANLGPAFDSMALALGIWDEYETRTTADDQAVPVIQVRGEGAAHVPRDADHLVYRSMCTTWGRIGIRPPAGLRLVACNGVPHGRGLGSSAAAVVAGVVTASGLHQVAQGGTEGFDLQLAADLASELEGHPDNATASLYGGLTLSFIEDATGRLSTAQPASRPVPVRTVQVQCLPEIRATVALPAAELSTAVARAILPARVPHGEAALGAARAALLVHAMTTDPSLLLPATRDWLHQEQRRSSYPDTMALVDVLRAAGLAAVVSGAGPGVLVLSATAVAEQVALVAERELGCGWSITEPGIARTGATLQRV